MKLLVLGYKGQLGTDIMRALQQRGAADDAITLDVEDIDVSKVDKLKAALAPYEFDALVNCTSYHKTDEVESNANLAFAINTHAVRKMAELCGEKGARLLHVSTDYVFEGTGEKPLTEDDPTGAINVYGASKAMGERLALMSGADVLIYRVASLYGVAGALGKGGNFVETMIRFGKEKGALRVIDDQTMSPTATADVAKMILKGLDAGIGRGIYHAVNCGQATWYEFACRIIEQAGVEATVTPIPHTEFPTAAMRPAFSVLDNAKLTALIGNTPHWHDALDRYLKAKGHVD